MADPARPAFRRSPTPAPAAGAVPVREGNLPLARDKVYISDSTRRQLNEVGWEDGVPPHPDLGELLERIRADMAADDAAFDKENRPTEHTTVRPAKTLKLEDLKPEHRREIEALMAEAKQLQKAPVRTAPVTHNPNVAGAIQQLQAVSGQSAGPRIEDDLMTEAVQTGARGKITMPVKAAPQPEAEPEAEPEHNHDTTGALGQTVFCPRCNWDVRQPLTADPTDEDRKQFLTAVLSLQRFTKDLPLMDGELVVTYRTLTSVESQTVFRQIMFDERAGKLPTQGQVLMALTNYRMCLSIESVRRRDRTLIAEVPPLSEIPYEAPADGTPETPLVPLLDWVTETILPQEHLQRMIGQQHRHFQRLVEALEAQSREPSFWKGIEPQR